MFEKGHFRAKYRHPVQNLNCCRKAAALPADEKAALEAKAELTAEEEALLASANARRHALQKISGVASGCW